MTEIIVIEPGRYERNYWGDLWRYRELFRVLAWRDLAVRYKQTVIGILWAVLRPFLTMLVFVVIFSKIAKLPTEAGGWHQHVFALQSEFGTKRARRIRPFDVHIAD